MRYTYHEAAAALPRRCLPTIMQHMFKDFAIVAISIGVAVVIAQLDGIERMLSFSGEIRVAGALIAGILFTSVFTTAPAAVVLAEISQVESLFLVSFLGAT